MLLALVLFGGLWGPARAHDDLQKLIEQNCEMFLEDMRARADAGDAQAQFILGESYSAGYCVQKDPAAVFGWYRKAAEGGVTGAQFHLGLLYFEGSGIPQDYTVAHGWLLKAAEGGDAAAPVLLGTIYEAGVGMPEDPVRAYMWYSIGAAQGDEEARQRRDGLAGELEPGQVAEAQQMARDWWAGHQ